MANLKILVVEDDPAMREVLEMRLEQWGYKVNAAGDARQAEEIVKSVDPDLIISDVVLPDVSGIELLPCLRGGNSHRPVILITAHGTVDMAVEAMKDGAQDFLTKPLDYSKLKATLDSAAREIQLRHGSLNLTSQLEKGSGFGPFIGTSKAMREVYKLIQAVAGSNASVLITGESGTGKELAARTIHERSQRANGPFLPINAAAIPHELIESEIFGHEKGSFTGATERRQGCFELADGGTLFLDEIVEMPASLQTKLLRVLEDGRVRRVGGKQELTFDVRVLAATNRNPGEAVKEGRLREDLYYRLNVFTLYLPPLRERRSDIPILAQHFIAQFNEKHDTQVLGLREEVVDLFKEYNWPGNVRELKNVIERAVVLAKAEWVEFSHLPPYIREPTGEADRLVIPLGITAAEAEKRVILKTLEHTANNKAEAARLLGLDVKTIRNKLKSYGLM